MPTISQIFCVLCLCVLAAAGRGATTLYVAPDGDDKAAGTAKAPLATLEGARDALRRLRKAYKLGAGGAVVRVQGGTYERTAAFELTAEDSGFQGGPIVYRAAEGAEVRLSGGRAVGGFEPVRDAAARKRVAPAARGKVLETDLKAQGVRSFGKLTRRGFGEPIRPAHMELFFADRPMTLARWPNEGYARIAGLPDGQRGRRFAYSGDRPKRWAGEDDVWVYGYWYHDWADTYMKVEVIDTDKRIITTKTKHRYGLRKGNRWHVLNVLAELDAPGEYYVDRRRGMLYFWPPAPVAKGRAVVSVAEQLITMKDTAHVTVRGLTLEACRGTAVTISGGHHCRIVTCTIRNVGNRGVAASGGDHAIVGCDICNTGDGGVSLRGGDRRTLTPARLLAENNHIHDYSRWCHTYRPAVSVGGCGNVVRHNLLHHGQHSAIQLGGNDHLIELNEVHSVCTDTGDVGAFYMGRDWTARGTVIRHNYWHHIRGPGRIGAMGVYLDDQASGIRVFGNVFYDVSRAVFIGGGCDNVVENNIFVDCRPAVHIDARGLGWQRKATDDPKGTLRTRLRSMPYKNALWSKRYPNLVNILNDDPGTPKRNRVVRNVCVGGRWDDIHTPTRKHQIIRDNLVGTDPRFVDRRKLDFRLRKDSPAFALGFKLIPFDRIGLYKDERRASWPVRHEPIELPAMPPPKPRRKIKPQTGPPPVCTAPRLAAKVTVDGRLEPAEWNPTGKVEPLVLREDFYGDRTPRTSTAWVHHDGACLYVAFDNMVKAKPKLKTGHRWGVNDAVEIAIRSASASKNATTLVLRGYVDGTFESSTEAGASKAAAAKAKQGVEYKAFVVSPTRWTAEWKVPFASLGIDPTKPATFAFNLSVRKTADDLWLMWRSTRGNTHNVAKAGRLKLGA